MDELQKTILSTPPSKDNLRKTCIQNGIKLSYLTTMSICKTKKIIKKLIVIYKQNICPVRCNWFESELKLFRFALILFSAYYFKPISDFKSEQWSFLQKIFRQKPQQELQYEAKKFLTNKAILKKKWCSEEEQILINLIRKYQVDPDWNQIAIQLYMRSSRQFFRTPKQCKQRWINHLDPEVKHGDWTIDEDRILIQNVYKMGKKWSAMTKELSNQRTQHMVKNRFMSLLLKAKKKFPSIIQEETLIEEIGKQIGLTLRDYLSQKSKIPKLKADNSKQYEQQDQEEKQEQISRRINRQQANQIQQKHFFSSSIFYDELNTTLKHNYLAYIIPSSYSFYFPQTCFDFRNIPSYPVFFPSSN